MREVDADGRRRVNHIVVTMGGHGVGPRSPQGDQEAGVPFVGTLDPVDRQEIRVARLRPVRPVRLTRSLGRASERRRAEHLSDPIAR